MGKIEKKIRDRCCMEEEVKDILIKKRDKKNKKTNLDKVKEGKAAKERKKFL